MNWPSIVAVSVHATILSLIANVTHGQVGVLDQFHIARPVLYQGHNAGASATHESAQTFTVGVEGILSQVELGVRRTSDFDAPFIVDIARIVAGKPDFSDAGILARQTIPASEVPILQDLDIYFPEFTVKVNFAESKLYVRPDDVLAIIVRGETPASEWYLWWTNVAPASKYTRGAIFELRKWDGGIVTSGSTYYDTHFRTFVLIPEPTTATFVVVCSLGFATLRTRRKTLQARNLTRQS